MPPATFTFGPYTLPVSEAFYLTPLTVAIVNIKPILPGHILVLPRRATPRFCDLSPAEVADLWTTVHTLAPGLEKHFSAQALTMAIQDGQHAGQSVPHVHVHVIPRRGGDFERNDDVYDRLDDADMAPSKPAVDAPDHRPQRTQHEMAREAAVLRTLFDGSLPLDPDV